MLYWSAWQTDSADGASCRLRLPNTCNCLSYNFFQEPTTVVCVCVCLCVCVLSLNAPHHEGVAVAVLLTCTMVTCMGTDFSINCLTQMQKLQVIQLSRQGIQ